MNRCSESKKKKKEVSSVVQMLTGFCTCTLGLFFFFSFCFIFWSYLRIILWIEKSFLSYIGFSKDKKK